jgi:hypothetical protein
MIELADLHNHSARSKDGITEPETLIDMAAERGLAALGICDHDVLPPDNADALADHARQRGVRLALGVEISCRKAHVIGYGLQPRGAALEYLRDRFERMRESAERVGRELVDELVRRGFDISADAVAQRYGKPPQKAFILRYMAEEMGAFPSWTAARQYLLSQDFYVHDDEGIEELSPVRAVEMIREAGGVAVWAHPLFTPEPYRSRYMDALPRAGLHAVEAVYAYQENGYPGGESNAVLEAWWRTWAQDNGLAVSGGSDSHYPVKTLADGTPLAPGYCGVTWAEARKLGDIFL